MAKKAASSRAGTSRIPKPRSRKYVYFFGNGKADGNRHMKDLLGGKGNDSDTKKSRDAYAGEEDRP